jgi:hypothetical protein
MFDAAGTESDPRVLFRETASCPSEGYELHAVGV